MQSNSPQTITHPVANEAKKSKLKIKTTVIVGIVLALVSLNIAIVTNEKVHDTSYSAVKAILASVLPEEVLSRLLSKSPTAKKQSDIRMATKTLAHEKAVLSASKQALEKKHLDLEKSHRQIETKHSELKRVTGKRIAATQNFTKRLASRVATGASRAAATAIPKSTPYVGTAIVVAITAYDLYDACETMKEISELKRELGLESEDPTKVCGLKPPSL